jgi:hypothetical protein
MKIQYNMHAVQNNRENNTKTFANQYSKIMKTFAICKLSDIHKLNIATCKIINKF